MFRSQEDGLPLDAPSDEAELAERRSKSRNATRRVVNGKLKEKRWHAARGGGGTMRRKGLQKMEIGFGVFPVNVKGRRAIFYKLAKRQDDLEF